jgi:serralysin
LFGGAGNDKYQFADTDTIETDTLTEAANAGNDVLDFSNLTTAVTVKLTSETELAMHTNRTIKTSATGTAKLAANFENVIGGAGDDQILGNVANNRLLGGTGNDTIIGGGGNDTIRGGDDDDTLIGGLGADSIFGDSGNDLGLGGRGGAARSGTCVKDTGDRWNASIETIDEAFATVFAFEL